MDILSVIITSALLGICGIIFRMAFGKKVSGRIMRLLWAVIFIKFALPVNIPAMTSVMNLIGNNAEISAPMTVPSQEDITPSPVNNADNIYPVRDNNYPLQENNTLENNITNAAPQYLPADNDTNNMLTATENKTEQTEPYAYEQEKPALTETAQSGTDISMIIRNIYLAVAVMLIAAIAVAYACCAVRFSRFERTENAKIEEIIKNFRKSSPHLPKVTVVSGDIGTPAVFGILFPKIILTDDVVYDDKSINHIISHELTHIRHFDPLWNAVTLIICALNWYNPVVWLCRYCYLKDAERHCDESVIARLGNSSRHDYAESLLKCAAGHSSRLSLISGFGESDIKTRIKAVLSAQKMRIGYVITGVAVIIMSVLVFGTGAAEKAALTVIENSGTSYIYDSKGLAGTAEIKTLSETADGENSWFAAELSLESKDYKLNTVKADVSLYSVKTYGFPDEELVTLNASGTAKYSADLDPEAPSLHFYADFDFNSGNFGGEMSPYAQVTFTYTLKKGSASEANEYTVTKNIFPDNDDDYYAHVTTDYFKEYQKIALNVTETDTGYEIRPEETELYVFISRYDNSRKITVRRDTEQGYDEIKAGENGFDPYRTQMYLRDLTGDGVSELIMITHFTGTGVTSNGICILDPVRFREIPIDTKAIDSLVQTAVIDQNSAGNNIFDISFEDKLYRAAADYVPDDISVRKNENGSVSFGNGQKFEIYEDDLYCSCMIEIYDEKYSHWVTGIASLDVGLTYDGEKIIPNGKAYLPLDSTNPYKSTVYQNTYEYFDNFTAVISESGGARFYAPDHALDLVLMKSSLDSPVITVYNRDYSKSVRIEQQGGIKDIHTEILDLTRDGKNDLVIIDEGGNEQTLHVIDGAECEEIPADVQAAHFLADNYTVIPADPARGGFDVNGYGYIDMSQTRPSEGEECRYSTNGINCLYLLKTLTAEAGGQLYDVARVSVDFAYNSERKSFIANSSIIFTLDQTADPYDIEGIGVEEEALNADRVLWSKTIYGLNSPVIADFVRGEEGNYYIRLVSDSLYYINSVKVPVTDEDMRGLDAQQCFRFTELDNMYSPYIIFSVPESGGMNRAYFYMIGDFYRIRALEYVDINGNTNGASGVTVSNGLKYENGIFFDTVTDSTGRKADVRYISNDSGQIREILHGYGGAYADLANIDTSKADASAAVSTIVSLTNGDTWYYPEITGDIMSVENILHWVRNVLDGSVYTEPEDFLQNGRMIYDTTFRIKEEIYKFCLFDDDTVLFEQLGTGRKGYFTLDEQGAHMYRDALRITAGGFGEYLVEQFANQIELGQDRRLSQMDKLVYSSEGYTPSKWEVMKGISVFENVQWSWLEIDTDYIYPEVYKVTFDLNSSDPAPFKNGHNEIAVEIGALYQSNLARITRICDVDKYLNHYKAFKRTAEGEPVRSPEYTVYDFINYCRGEMNFANPDEISKDQAMFYLLYSGEPSGLTSDERQFEGMTKEQLEQAAEHAFGQSMTIPQNSIYYSDETGKYYLLGLDFAPPDDYLIADTREEGEYVYVTVEKYKDSLNTQLESSSVFTLKMRENGDGYYILEARG